MLAIPSAHEGMWLSVGARVQESFNAAPADGVEIHVVDERSSVCPGQGPCWGTRRSVTPYPTDRTDRLAHVPRARRKGHVERRDPHGCVEDR